MYTDVYVRNKVEEDRILTSTGHTNVMTGGVRFGLCTKEEREVVELLEEVETRRK